MSEQADDRDTPFAHPAVIDGFPLSPEEKRKTEEVANRPRRGDRAVRPPRPGIAFRWYSICSAHCAYQENCDCCNAGSWRFEPASIFGRALFRVSPRLWQRWANRG